MQVYSTYIHLHTPHIFHLYSMFIHYILYIYSVYIPNISREYSIYTRCLLQTSISCDFINEIDIPWHSNDSSLIIYIVTTLHCHQLFIYNLPNLHIKLFLSGMTSAMEWISSNSYFCNFWIKSVIHPTKQSIFLFLQQVVKQWIGDTQSTHFGVVQYILCIHLIIYSKYILYIFLILSVFITICIIKGIRVHLIRESSWMMISHRHSSGIFIWRWAVLCDTAI